MEEMLQNAVQEDMTDYSWKMPGKLKTIEDDAVSVRSKSSIGSRASRLSRRSNASSGSKTSIASEIKMKQAELLARERHWKKTTK